MTPSTLQKWRIIDHESLTLELFIPRPVVTALEQTLAPLERQIVQHTEHIEQAARDALADIASQGPCLYQWSTVVSTVGPEQLSHILTRERPLRYGLLLVDIVAEDPPISVSQSGLCDEKRVTYIIPPAICSVVGRFVSG